MDSIGGDDLINYNRLNSEGISIGQEWIKTKETFKRAEILEKAVLLGVKDRTLSDILKRFIKLKLIEKVSHGIYTKR